MATQSITTPTPTQQTGHALVTVSPGKLAAIRLENAAGRLAAMADSEI
jgi:hypothetical protein